MITVLRKLEAFAKSPIVELSVGLILVATGVIEAGETFIDDLATGDFALHHGVIVLGLAHALKALPSVAAGAALLADGEHRR